ncbi:MAG: hypothetical protein AAB499_00715 [Patescibacteria group bacterium]
MKGRGVSRAGTGEAIKVLASFAPNKIRIHFFSWRDQVYRVESFNLFHISSDQEERLYHFAVSSAGNSYQLAFSPRTLQWRLIDINPRW